MKEKLNQRRKSAFETREAVMAAADMAGIETSGLSFKRISQRVIEAADKIEYPPQDPKYRKILEPEGVSPLAKAVVKIAWHNILGTHN